MKADLSFIKRGDESYGGSHGSIKLESIDCAKVGHRNDGGDTCRIDPFRGLIYV